MSCAGSLMLTDTVVLVYGMDIRTSRFRLDAAVLLRGTRPGWPDHDGVHRWRPEPALGPGGGASPGRHNVFIPTGGGSVWMNRAVQLSLNDCNVVLLDNADDPVDLPVVREMLSIDPDLGPAPTGQALSHLLHLAVIDAQDQLTRTLEESIQVRQFLQQ